MSKMNFNTRWWRIATAVSVATTLSLPSHAREREEGDDASARAAWQAYWLNEIDNPVGQRPGQGRARKPIYSQKYRKFLMEAAAKERARYESLMPTGESSSTITDATETRAATGTTWVNIGPTTSNYAQNGGSTVNVPDGGRPVAIVTDPSSPNVVYVALSGGGVWKSTDGGTTWAPKTETLGSLSCGHLAMDPNNSQILYLGLGDSFDGTGIGLVKSTDGGETWSAPVFLGDSSVIAHVAVAPSDSNVVLAATNRGLFRSVNAGASFSAVSLATGSAEVPNVWSIAWTGNSSFAISLEASPSVTNGTTDGQVWTSTNNGATWTKASGMAKTGGVGRISLASAPSNRSIVYAMAAVPNSSSATDLADFFRSTNGGGSWVALGATGRKVRYTNSNTESTGPSSVLNGQGWYNHMLIVHPTNPNTFYFGGALLMGKAVSSTGTSWSYTQLTNWLAQFSLPYVHADFHAATFDSVGKLYVGSDGGVFRSSDIGSTWSGLNNGLATHLIYSVGSSPAAPSAVIGGFQDNGTRVRSGSGTIYNQEIGGDGFGSHMHPVNGNTMLGSLYYARIYKSTDGGLNFSSASSGITESNNSSSAPFNTKVVPWLGDASGNTVYTHANNKVYRSTNYAASWTALGTTGLVTSTVGVIRNVNVAKSSSSYVGVVGSGGRVYLSNNGGSSWTKVAEQSTNLGLSNNGLSLSHVAFDISNPNTVYVSSVAAGSNYSHLWKSTNFGTSWTAIDTNPGFPTGVPVNVVVPDPVSPQTLYVGTHLGVYRTDDGGANWTRFGAGMPLVNVTDVYVSSDSSVVRAATFGRSFWELQP